MPIFNKEPTNSIASPIMKAAAYFFSFILIATPALPVMAKMNHSETLKKEIEGHPLFTPLLNSRYTYTTPKFVEGSVSTAYNIESFYKRLKNTNPQKVQHIASLDALIGTPAVQTRYIRSQITQILGRTLINSFEKNEEQQLKTLYDNAISFALSSNLNVGSVLTQTPPSDMVWPEFHIINSKRLLIPVVYLTQNTIDKRLVNSNETTFGGDAFFNELVVSNTQLNFQRENFLQASNLLLTNNAAIISAGDQYINVTRDITNANDSTISSRGALTIALGGDLNNLSSIIVSQDDLTITASNINNETLVFFEGNDKYQKSHYGTISGINSKDGNLTLASTGNINYVGATSQAGKGLTLDAQGNIKIGTAIVSALSHSKNASSESTTHITSSLTAKENISLIAAGEIELDAATIASDEGHIEILAGMGITIDSKLNSKRSHSKYKSSGKSIEESAYETVAMRAVLDAGKNIIIHADAGDIKLRSVDITSQEGTDVTAKDGQIQMLLTVEDDQYNYNSVKKSLLTVKTVSRGHDKQNAVPNTIIGGIAVQATKGVFVEYEGDPEFTLEEQIDKLSTMEGMEWMQVVSEHVAPENWAEIQVQYDEWNDETTSISPALAAVISIAVAVWTGGAGAETLFAAMQNAGLSSLASQSTLALANGAVNGDIKGAMKDLASKDTFKNVATAMVTAGAMHQINATFFSPSSEELQTLASKNLSPAAYAKEIKQLQALTLGQQATQAVTNASVSAAISTAIQGTNFSDSFKQSLLQSASSKIGSVLSDELSALSSTGQWDKAIGYIVDTSLGCITGAINSAGSELSSDDGCAGGAGGALISAIVTDIHTESTYDKRAQLEADRKDELAFIMSNGEYASKDIYYQATKGDIAASIAKIDAQGGDLAKLSAAFTALLAGIDVSSAATAAESTSLRRKQANVIDIVNVLTEAQNDAVLLGRNRLLDETLNNLQVEHISDDLLQMAEDISLNLQKVITDSGEEIYILRTGFETGQVIASEAQLVKLIAAQAQALQRENALSEQLLRAIEDYERAAEKFKKIKGDGLFEALEADRIAEEEREANKAVVNPLIRVDISYRSSTIQGAEAKAFVVVDNQLINVPSTALSIISDTFDLELEINEILSRADSFDQQAYEEVRHLAHEKRGISYDEFDSVVASATTVVKTAAILVGSGGIVKESRDIAKNIDALITDKDKISERIDTNSERLSSLDNTRETGSAERPDIGVVTKSGPKLLTHAPKTRFFKGDEAVKHFERHGSELMGAFGRKSYNLKDYLNDANHVIKNGTFVPEMNGYVRLIGGQGSAKYGFVGLDRATGGITTFHTKSVSELARKAPSLGFSK